MRFKKFLFFVAYLGCLSVLAQQTEIHTNPHSDFSKAVNLYNDKHFLASQTMFQNIKDSTDDQSVIADCEYYIANSAIRLGQYGADDLMDAYVKKYPGSVKRNIAYTQIAEYYFDTGNYGKALKWYDKAEIAHVPQQDREKLLFNEGYCLFVKEQYREAALYFEELKQSPKYGKQANYYIGFIAYRQDEYDKANQVFQQLEEDENVYSKKLSYYQADMNFKVGKFDEAIEAGKKQLQVTKDRKEISEMSKIIGESYFNKGEYNKAIPYLKDYKGQRGRISNTDYYQLGYAYYKQGDYPNAIGQFNKIIEGKNEVAQNAYYHLAECYLKLDKKQEALSAFRNAANMGFNSEIAEDAGLNYAKLSYEIGSPYESVPEIINNYINKYPNAPENEYLGELLISSYITSKDYKSALEVMESSNTFYKRDVFQKVAFYRGVELYNEKDFDAAKAHFEKSNLQGQDAQIKARATYWIAQMAYNDADYDTAIANFQKLISENYSASIPESDDVKYDLAYCYFKKKDYNNAIRYFEQYVSGTVADQGKKNDAYLRLADSYFVRQ